MFYVYTQQPQDMKKKKDKDMFLNNEWIQKKEH